MLNSLEKNRQSYQPQLPEELSSFPHLTWEKKEATTSLKDQEEIERKFPKTFGRELLKLAPQKKGTHKPYKVGVVLSGGQAPGGHNVIAGLYDALHQIDPRSELYGFLGGPQGILDGSYKKIEEKELKQYRNCGGFHLIGSGRTKIETEDQLKASDQLCKKMGLDGLVIIGGDDSNTNAALLAEYFKEKGNQTAVIGIPKTIDGDLKNQYVDISFGFDSATKIYAEMIGNLCMDALSAKKYYHFVKLMGRSASHITLECALKTQPNLALISEEKKGLIEIRDEICQLVEERAKIGKNYGIILIPEGLIEFIPEIKSLISSLNNLLAEGKEGVIERIDPENRKTFDLLPKEIQEQLLLDRDPHGNVQVSKISTEKLLIELVKNRLGEKNFHPIDHFFGYEGRSGYPSNFDATYCYSLGFVAALLIQEEMSGYMAAISNLSQPVKEWEIYGLPITSLMNIEERKGKKKAVIQKALVDLQGKAFKTFSQKREEWKLEDRYQSPGPIQFHGEPSITESSPLIILNK